MRKNRLLIVFLCAAICSCSKQGDPEEAPAAITQTTRAEPMKVVSYEIVTTQRPESVADFHKLYRAAYDICVQIRKSKGLPPPAPLATPAGSFITHRDTYISDGSATYVKNEVFTYKVESDGDAPSCSSGEQKAWDSEIVRDGTVYHSGVDADGQAYTDSSTDAPPPEPGDDRSYTESKVIKGFAVKCMKLAPGMDKLLTEQCAVDLKPGTVYQGRRPIVVAERATIVENLAGALLTEPMVIKIGQPVDKHIFDVVNKP